MSVTTTSYTTNTKKITILNEFGNGSTNVISAVDSAITGGGWTLYDTINTTLFNPMVTKVYRVLNADGVSYKYMILRWDTIKLMLYTSCCETWSTGTHFPYNESWTNAGAFGQGYDLSNGFFLINASARHCMIWNWILGTPGMWAAVIEFERIAPEDIASASTATPYPCYAWTNSIMIGTPYGNYAQGYQKSPWMFAFPRTADGSTGAQACMIYAPVTNRGMWPPNPPQGIVSIGADAPANLSHLGSYYYNLTYGWNNVAVATSTLSVDAGTTYTPFFNSVASAQVNGYLMPFGRAYNFGVTGVIGRAGDTTLANLDATYGWPSGTTVQSEALLLPLSGGNESYSQYQGSGLPNPGSGTMYTTTGNVGNSVVPMKAIQIGDTMWVATGNASTSSSAFNNTGGIMTFSISSGNYSPPLFRVNVGSQSGGVTNSSYAYGGVYDIMFDGNNYVYATTANGVMQVNVTSFSTVFITSNQTLANGCGYLSMDNKNVYATARVGNSRPQVYTIDRATGNVWFGNTYNPPSNSMVVGQGWGTPIPDYTGNVYVANQPGQGAGTTATYYYLGTFSANTGGNVTQLVNGISNNNLFPAPAPTAVGWAAANGQGAPQGIYYDYISGRLWNWFINAGTFYQHYMIEVFPLMSPACQPPTAGWFNGNLGGITSYNTGTTGFVFNNGVNIANNVINWHWSNMHEHPTPDGRGELYAYPYRGYHIVTSRRPGLDVRGSTNSYTTNTTALLKFISGEQTLFGNIGGAYPTGIYGFNTGAASILDTAQGGPIRGANMVTSNNVNLLICHTSGFNNQTGPNTSQDNRIMLISGLYNGNNTSGYAMSRLLLKG